MVWFLSQDGSDTPSCGRNEVSACRTLHWLLDRFYNATGHLNEKTLSLMTDISLVINDILAVSIYFKMSLLLFQFKSIPCSQHNAAVVLRFCVEALTATTPTFKRLLDICSKLPLGDTHCQ